MGVSERHCLGQFKLERFWILSPIKQLFDFIIAAELGKAQGYCTAVSAKIWIESLFYVVLSFFKKGETIQGGTLFKGGHYSRGDTN